MSRALRLAPMFCVFPVILLAACVVDGDDWFGGAAVDRSLDAWPSVVPAGDTTVLTIHDDYGNTDFDEMWDLRPVGEFGIVEWSSRDDELQLLVQPDRDAEGDQLLALDFNDGTSYVSFQVE
jgi:hypothetical protein